MKIIAVVTFLIALCYSIEIMVNGGRPFGLDYWLVMFSVLLSLLIILN